MELGQRQEDGPWALDISRRKTTGELYALRWDRDAGRLHALAGPLTLEQIAASRPADLSWQPVTELPWATSEEWMEQAVVEDPGAD